MELIRTIAEMQSLSSSARRNGQHICFVPTMGALHAGHAALLREARQRGDVLVASIYVNPLQFGPNEDFSRYPRTLEADLALCADVEVDAVFTPDTAEMYPNGFCTTVSVAKLSDTLCGKSRPGHFDGVATVVLKLFNAVQPHVAVFGEKDFQQLVIIRQLVGDLNLPVSIIGHPTVRDVDGLALSSRNRHLTPEQRQGATIIPRALQHAQQQVAAGERDATRISNEASRLIQQADGKVDYVSIVDAETLQPLIYISGPARIFLATFFGTVRLIDNAELTPINTSL